MSGVSQVNLVFFGKGACLADRFALGFSRGVRSLTAPYNPDFFFFLCGGDWLPGFFMPHQNIKKKAKELESIIGCFSFGVLW